MSTFDRPWGSSLSHRKTSRSPDEQTIPDLLRTESNPIPSKKPFCKLLAFGFITILGCLQFLPATHFRDPSDPFRNWVPRQPRLSSILSSSGNPNDEGSSLTTKNDEDDMIHIVSWIECLDLRMLAVLANSTLSSSRYPDRIYFHFFAPEGNKDMVSFYRLKVLFPYTNIQFHGQEEVEEIIRGAISETQFGSLNVAEIAPFVVPIVHQSLGKFIFVSPDVIIKGGVDELVAVELGSHAVAAAEDCSKRLNTYVNSDVLGAVQRSASKPWVSETPYDKNSCMPESSLLLIDARKIGKDFLDGFLWWSRVLNLSERNNQNNPVLALALYDRYLKLSNSWFVRDSGSPEIQNGIAAIRYDGPKSVCSGLREDAVVNSSSSNLWSLYLPPLSDQILGI